MFHNAITIVESFYAIWLRGWSYYLLDIGEVTPKVKLLK